MRKSGALILHSEQVNIDSGVSSSKSAGIKASR